MLGSSYCKWLAAGAYCCLQVSVASATISFNVDYTDAIIGNILATEAATANATATKMTSMTLGGYVTATTVAGFPGGDSSDKVLLVTSNSTSKSSSTNARADLFFRAADSDGVNSGQYKVTMTICFANLDNGNSNHYFYINLRDGSGTAFGGFGINFATGAGYLNSGTGSNPGMLASISKGSVHTLELLVDLDANTQKLTMDGNINLGTSVIKDGISFQQLSINTDTISQGKLYIDDVTIAPVPEPAALGMLGAGAMASVLLVKSKAAR